ncbi:LytR/AlgR family response regulator transcription factor [Chitinophaga barathri]|uniref:DNA-binding response regulator n=1 Tax=Chitinophaga barathri TaxID=1647451 RepID=A0A3N4MS76_9BACT|nr:LytTR family DNA-binding domain-containing protein [Chitinophaga barathri]RPD38243.1 DNA-binding response regulator [Chitinophaga barathri]
MLKAVLIDDEPHNLLNLRRLLEQHCSEVTVAGEAHNADEGILQIGKHQPDIVFLDIQMPGKNGFDVLLALPDAQFEVVFVTAYDQYGIQAVKFSAMDYLLKPVNIDELKGAVSKALQRRAQKDRQLGHLLTVLKQGSLQQDHRIVLPSAKENRLVFVNDITRCESNNSYTTMYLRGGEKMLVSVPLFEYEEMLRPYGFVRCHQSHLVNRRHVRSILKDGGMDLLMEDGSRVPVSRDRKDKVRQELVN